MKKIFELWLVGILECSEVVYWEMFLEFECDED